MQLEEHVLPGSEVLLLVGKIILAAARLEFEARMFAVDICDKRPNPKSSLRELKRAITRDAGRFPEAETICTWINEAYVLWDDRGVLAHSVWMDVYDESDPLRHELIAQRGFATLNTEPEFLTTLFHRFMNCLEAGYELGNTRRERAMFTAPAWGGPFGIPKP